MAQAETGHSIPASHRRFLAASSAIVAVAGAGMVVALARPHETVIEALWRRRAPIKWRYDQAEADLGAAVKRIDEGRPASMPRDEWMDLSGYTAIEAAFDAVYEDFWAIDDAIMAEKAVTVGDLRIQAMVTEARNGDDGPEERYVDALIASIKQLAA